MPTSQDVQRLITIADRLLRSKAEVYGDISGAPTTQTSQQQPMAKLHAEYLSSFKLLLAGIEGMKTAFASPRFADSTQPPAFQIEELSPEAATSQEAAADLQALFIKACLAAFLYAADSSLLSPWTSHQLETSSNQLMTALSKAFHPATGCQFTGVESSSSPTAIESAQDLIAYLLPSLLSTLIPQHQSQNNYSTVQLNPSEGPGTFQRCLAARQLAYLVRQLDYEHLSRRVDSILPQVMLVIKDQSPSVKHYGLHALQHLLQEALPADLRPHQRMLLSTARDILVGCEDTVWPIAVPTACAAVCALGTAGQGPGYVELMQEMLRQANMQGHKPAKRLIWLQAIQLVLPVLGLLTLRFFTSLMPTLLEWCYDPDQATQLEALRALQTIVQHTWPRMTIHAPLLWDQLQKIAAQHAGCCMQSEQQCTGSAHDVVMHGQIKEILCNITEMLYWCGGSTFQEQLLAVRQTNASSKVLLQAIEMQVTVA